MSAISVTARSGSQCSNSVRWRHDYYAGDKPRCGWDASAPTLQSLRRAVRDGDAPMVGQQVLQAAVQRGIPSRNHVGPEHDRALVEFRSRASSAIELMGVRDTSGSHTSAYLIP